MTRPTRAVGEGLAPSRPSRIVRVVQDRRPEAGGREARPYGTNRASTRSDSLDEGRSSMKKKAAISFALLFALAALPRFASASPEKSAGPLEVTYYYLPG
jgi:hypothetical protein